MPASRTHPLRRRRFRGESGFVLALTGMLLIPLVVFTAFAVDLGAWYAQAAHEQRAVDAASLAGVVQLPTTANAISAALTTLNANGYSCKNSAGAVTYNQGVDTTSASVPCAFSFPTSEGEEMRVSLYSSATQYFSTVALKGESLTRSATAVYNTAIPLGSPNNFLGNNLPNGCTNPSSTTSPCPNPNVQPNLWAAIQGPLSRHQDGDPYATMCSTDTESQGTCDPGYPKQYGTLGASFQNPDYNGNGYIWAVDIPKADVGTTVTVQIYDPATANGGTGAPLYESVGGATSDFHTSYELFNTTGTSANISEDPSLSMKGKCTTAGPGQNTFGSGSSPPVAPAYAGVAPYYTEAWYTLCSFTPSVAGVYPLQVKTSDIPGVADAGTGWNVYSVRAVAGTGSGSQPDVYGIKSMSIWTAQPGTTANFYLANIGTQYAGHTLDVELYDPGDGTGSSQFTMQFVPPPSGLGTVPTGSSSTSCQYNSVGNAAAFGVVDSTSSTCKIVTKTTSETTSGSSTYNGKWLRVEIAIPSNYTCSSSLVGGVATQDCWWWIHYDLGASASTPNDRTTWVVSVLGDPVHLVQ